MRPGLLLCCGVVLLWAASGCHRAPPLTVAASESPPTVRLDFRPPADRALTESVRAIWAMDRRASPPSVEVEMLTRSRFTSVDGGWLLAQTVPRSKMLRDGREVDTYLDDVLARFTLQVRLAADGTLVGLVAPEAAREVLKQVVPAGRGASELEAFLAPEVLEARTRREWESKYGGLLQRNLTEGQRTWAVEVWPVGSSQVAYVLERTVRGTRDSDFGDAVVWSLRCLDAIPADAPEELTDVYAAARSPALTPGVTCEGEQVVARARFVPVHRALTVRARVDGEAWTLSTETKALELEEAR